MEKKILTAFPIVASERPFDDYETFCALQNLNGADLGKTYTARSACTEFLHHISDVLKEETGVKLRESNFISVMADGGTDFGMCVTLIGNLANQLVILGMTASE